MSFILVRDDVWALLLCVHGICQMVQGQRVDSAASCRPVLYLILDIGLQLAKRTWSAECEAAPKRKGSPCDIQSTSVAANTFPM